MVAADDDRDIAMAALLELDRDGEEPLALGSIVGRKLKGAGIVHGGGGGVPPWRARLSENCDPELLRHVNRLHSVQYG